MARLTVTIPAELEEEIRRRQGDRAFSTQLAQDLAWYYGVIKSGIRGGLQKFTEREREIILEATKGFSAPPTMSEMLVRRGFYDIIEDFCSSQTEKTEEHSTVLEKYLGLNMIQRLTVIDWAIMQRDHAPKGDEAVALGHKLLSDWMKKNGPALKMNIKTAEDKTVKKEKIHQPA